MGGFWEELGHLKKLEFKIDETKTRNEKLSKNMRNL